MKCSKILNLELGKHYHDKYSPPLSFFRDTSITSRLSVIFYHFSAYGFKKKYFSMQCCLNKVVFLEMSFTHDWRFRWNPNLHRCLIQASNRIYPEFLPVHVAWKLISTSKMTTRYTATGSRHRFPRKKVVIIYFSTQLITIIHVVYTETGR